MPRRSSRVATSSEEDCRVKSPTLDYARLAEHLTDRGLVDRQTVQHVLQQCSTTGSLMPEILVGDGLVSDWEIARVCAELFHLPYLPLECYQPSEDARSGLDPEYLRQYGLVPLDRFGDVLTVSMPGVVPSTVLDGLVENTSIKIIPVVGSVKENRAWLNAHLPAPAETSLEAFGAALPNDQSSWANLFDDADQAVNFDLTDGL
jgi:hypothetical protein